ncbi:ATP-grasp domain-containing protein [Halobacteriales archaeon Cl-PHB]
MSENESATGFYSSHCDEAYIVPDPEEDLADYASALLDIASRPDVRTIIPTRETDIYTLSKYRDRFAAHVSLPVPSFETLRLVHDRKRLATQATEAGVPFPETRTLSTLDEWSDDFIVKSRYNLLVEDYLDTSDSRAGTEVKDQEHLTAGTRPDLAALQEQMHHDAIVQSYVPGEEYMVGALYDQGEPLATVQHRQYRGLKYTGSGGVYRESVSNPELEQVSRALLSHLDWHGLACLEYVRDERTGEFKLLEINPRMWQSLAANVRMGADFPYYYWLQATGRAGEIDDSYDVGIGCHWLKGEFLHLSSLVREESPLVERPGRVATVRDIVGSLVRHPHFDYLSREDPTPFVQDWWALLQEVPGIPTVSLPGASPTTWDGRADPEPAKPADVRKHVPSS